MTRYSLSLLVLVSYLPAILWGEFIWDDQILLDAEPVQDFLGLWQIWFSPSSIKGEGHYWPLVYSTFWFEYRLWGFSATGYHVVNVLLHLGNTLLVWHLMRRLNMRTAWFIAAVFAVHPLHVESVAWIIERKDVLSGFFYLASVLAWLRFTDQPQDRAWYVGSLGLYAAGLLSKSIVITLPVTLLILHWWRQDRITSNVLLRLIPFCVVGLVVVLSDLSYYQSREPLALDYSLAERTLIATYALWFYISKLLWPMKLTAIYPHWDLHIGDPLAWWGLFAFIVVIVALWWFRRRIGRGPLAGALFFVVTLSPVLGFVDYGYMQFSFVADRFQYLAGLGIIAIIIHWIASLEDIRFMVWGIIIVLGVLTWRQASLYQNEETFFRHIIAHNPNARSAHMNLGVALFEQGRYTEALEAGRIDLRQRPEHSQTHLLLGKILNSLERFEEAEYHFRQTLTFNPESQDATTLLSLVLFEQERYEEALVEALKITNLPLDLFHENLATIYYMLNRYNESLKHLDEALKINPDIEALRSKRREVREKLKGIE